MSFRENKESNTLLKNTYRMVGNPDTESMHPITKHNQALTHRSNSPTSDFSDTLMRSRGHIGLAKVEYQQPSLTSRMRYSPEAPFANRLNEMPGGDPSSIPLIVTKTRR